MKSLILVIGLLVGAFAEPGASAGRPSAGRVKVAAKRAATGLHTPSTGASGALRRGRTNRPQSRRVVRGRNLRGTTADDIRDREFRAVGDAFSDYRFGLIVLNKLRNGDHRAFDLLGVERPRGFNTRLVEWGIARTSSGRYAIHRGSHSMVWARNRDFEHFDWHIHPYSRSWLLGPYLTNLSVEEVLRTPGEHFRLIPSEGDLASMVASGSTADGILLPFVHLGGGRLGDLPRKSLPAPGTAVNLLVKNAREAPRGGHYATLEYWAGSTMLWRGNARIVMRGGAERLVGLKATVVGPMSRAEYERRTGRRQYGIHEPGRFITGFQNYDADDEY